MKNIYTLIFTLFIGINSFGQAFTWALSGGGTGDDESYCASVDLAGNVYVTGIYAGAANIGGVPISSPAVSDMFVAKYSSAGSGVWTQSSQSITAAGGHVLAADGPGNVYVAGEFDSTITIGTTQLTSAGMTDIFIAKFNPSGIALWAIRAGGPGKEGASSIRTDANGNIFVTGFFEDVATFGPNTKTSAGAQDVFVAKINSFSNFVWVTQAGGPLDDGGKGISLDNSGNIIIAGSFNATATFGSTTLVSTNPQPEMFISKLNTSGVIQWAFQGGGNGIDLAYEVATDQSGNSYVTGSFQDTATFAPLSVISNGGDDFYLAKYNSAGAIQWISSAGGPNNDKAYAMAFDQTGSVYITGSFDSLITIGTSSFTGFGGKDVFVAAYTTSGLVQWAVQAGGPGFDRGYGMTYEGVDGLYITGAYEQTANFGTTALNSAGLHDMFIAKISTTTGVGKINSVAQSLHIYPNPSSNFISINIPGSTLHQSIVDIFDTRGALVFHRNKSEMMSDQIDLSDFGTGLYEMRITAKGNLFTGRFIKN